MVACCIVKKVTIDLVVCRLVPVFFKLGVALFYGFIWLINYSIKSNSPWVDKLWLVLGGYVAGTSLTGAPLMVAVFMRNVAKERLRDTLFVLWFVLVSIKMTTLSPYRLN